MKYSKRLLVVWALLLFLGLPIVYIISPGFYSEPLGWNSTEATIVEIQSKKVPLHGGNSPVFSERPKLGFDNVGTFTYNVEGKEYKAEYYYLQAPYEVKVGRKFSIYYNPENPAEAAEVVPTKTNYMRFIMAGFGLILLGVGIVYQTRNSPFFNYG